MISVPARVLAPLLFCMCVAALGSSTSTLSPQEPLAFERNDGQHDPAIAFVGRGSAYSVVLDARGAAIAVPERRGKDATGKDITVTVLRSIAFAGATGPATIEPFERVPGVSNFFQGSSTRTNVPSFAQVVYRAVYPGVDAVFHASATNDLEIDFNVAPGASANRIALQVAGPWAISPNGDLHSSLGDSDLTLHRPIAYQLIAGVRHTVPVSYKLGRSGTVQLELGFYDPTYGLVIDPAISYATAIGKIRTLNGIAVDTQQNVYVVGSAADSSFTTTAGAFQPTFNGLEDAVIIKYNKAGQRIFATFLGAADVISRAIGVAVDDQEQIYVTGWTSVGYDATTGQAHFPITPGAYQSPPYVWDSTSSGSEDVFVTKLAASGSSLLFSSLVGGSGEQSPAAIALGPAPAYNVYVTGQVQGPRNDPTFKPFPTTAGAFRTSITGDPATFGNSDNFVFELSNNGSTLLASTLFGGSKGDSPNRLAVDTVGDVWLAGATYSADFPKTVNAYRSVFVGPTVTSGFITNSYSDVYVVKFNAALTQLRYGTYLTGSSQTSGDVPSDVATDPDNNAYVVGYTPSNDFPTTAGAFKTATHGGFITKFNAAGQVLFSTVLGGATPSNARTSIAGVRTSGDVVFVAGSTGATDFVTKGPLQAQNAGSDDIFICAFNSAGNVLEFSTYLGGNGSDGVYQLALDAASNLYMIGSTTSTNFPFSANAAEPPGSSFNSFYLKVNADRDGDGLLDWWELSGIDANGDGTIDFDLAARGAKVDHKDLFVEIDYMTAANHTHDPRTLPSGTALQTPSIDFVVTAFASAPVTNPDGTNGITLHATIDESIPEQPIISFNGTNSGFNAIKLGSPPSPCGAAHFGTVADRSSNNCANIIKAKRRVFRYALFAHDFAEQVGSTGIAEIGGNDFIVSLEAGVPWIDYGDLAARAASTYNTSLDEEWTNMLAGTFMHELGHTLSLEHGGGLGQLNAASRGVNCKPNYISVMNYTRQFNKAGLAPGTTSPTIRTDRDLDYSSAVLPPLNESALIEGSGVGGPTVEILYGEATTGIGRITSASGPIDFNGLNGIEANPVSADINKISAIVGCSGNSPGELLEGHDDWSNLVYNFRLSPYYADGTTISAYQQQEMTDADVSGALFATPPPVVAITSPSDGTRFPAGANITFNATATNPDGSVTTVYFVADSTLLATDTTTPYGTIWSNTPTGTHVLRVNAVDNDGGSASKQVMIHVGCTPAFTPSSTAIAFDTGGGSFSMSLPTGCKWTSSTNANWLLVTPADGDGSATFTFTAANNMTGSSRTGTITIAGQDFLVTQDPAPPFGAPTAVAATGTGSGTPTIHVTWHGTSGVANYEVAFSSNGTTYTTAGMTTDEFFDFTVGVSANAAYLVKVRAIATGGAQSAYSTPDLASTFVFTDDPLQSRVTMIKSVHWTELRTAVNAVRQVAGLTAAIWTANVAVGQTVTRTSVQELRTAIDGARANLGLSALTYTDATLTTDTVIKAGHLMEIRGGLQ